MATNITEQLRNMEKLIENKCVVFTPNKIAELNDSEVKVQIDLLENAFTKYNEAYEVESSSADDTKVDQLIEDMERVSMSFMKLKGLFMSRLDKANHILHDHENTRASEYQSIKLPAINLPTFDGKFDDWYPFKDQFTSIIHKNAFIDDSRKMQYLKSSLKGTAAQVIESMATTGENYIEAWSLLQNRYDNDCLIVQSNNVQQLLAQPVGRTEFVDALKTLLDGTNKHLRVLSVLKQPVDQWFAVMVGLVSIRLPHDARKDWELESSNFIGMPTWSQLRLFIENKVHALNMLQYKHTGTNASKSKQFTRIAAPTGTEQQSNANFSAFVCSQRHHIYKCYMFMASTPSDRLSIVKRVKLYFNRLRPTHNANKDTIEKICQICSSKDHTLLRVETNPIYSTETESTQPDEDGMMKNTDTSWVNATKHVNKCNTFLTATSGDRLSIAKRVKLYFNRLRPTHNASKGTIEKTCQICGSKDHTLLRVETNPIYSTETESTQSDEDIMIKVTDTSRVKATKHHVYKCNTFLTATSGDRLSIAKRVKLYFNRLRPTHNANKGTIEKTCQICGSKDHTLLRLETNPIYSTETESNQPDEDCMMKNTDTF